jgi:hypothetical protein
MFVSGRRVTSHVSGTGRRDAASNTMNARRDRAGRNPMNRVSAWRAAPATALLLGFAACTSTGPDTGDRAGLDHGDEPPSSGATKQGRSQAPPNGPGAGNASHYVVVQDAPYPRPEGHARFVRVDGRRIDTRPECGAGPLATVIPGHSGWPTLREATLGLLKHPGGTRAVAVSLSRTRAVIVIFRNDGTVRARSAVSTLDGRWFPENLTMCRRAIR